MRDLDELAQVNQPGMDLLVAVLDYLIEEPDTTAAGLIQAWADRDQRQQLEVLARPMAVPPSEPEAEFDDIVARLRDRGRRLRVEALLQVARERELSAGETEELRALTVARSGRGS